MSKKQKLGQFMTTNYEYILQNMNIPTNITKIIEPFAGNKDLINFIKNQNDYIIECYDIDPKADDIIKKDTLKYPPDYTNSFIITNPPYYARNKCADKTIFDKYNVNDLYKCFILEIINNLCLGGIIIIPINFFSSIRKNDIKLRKQFLQKYNVSVLNIFEEPVFDDTTSTVCAIQFESRAILENEVLSNEFKNKSEINTTFYPSQKKLLIKLNAENNFIVGGNIYSWGKESKYEVCRLTKNNINDKNTNILVKCIDDNLHNMICLKYVSENEIYIDKTPNSSARTYVTLIINPEISKSRQKKLVTEFNALLNKHRDKYNSLFLTNYRESKDIARKRISFELVYNIVRHILNKQDGK